jgi:hypothetical protein
MDKTNIGMRNRGIAVSNTWRRGNDNYEQTKSTPRPAPVNHLQSVTKDTRGKRAAKGCVDAASPRVRLTYHSGFNELGHQGFHAFEFLGDRFQGALPPPIKIAGRGGMSVAIQERSGRLDEKRRTAPYSKEREQLPNGPAHLEYGGLRPREETRESGEVRFGGGANLEYGAFRRFPLRSKAAPGAYARAPARHDGLKPAAKHFFCINGLAFTYLNTSG